MNGSHMKQLLLRFLVVCNLILLAVIAAFGVSGKLRVREQNQQLTALLERRGVRCGSSVYEALLEEKTAYTVHTDTAAQEAFCTSFLGAEVDSEARSGGTIVWSGERGSIEWTRGGSVSGTADWPEQTIPADMEKAERQISSLYETGGHRRRTDGVCHRTGHHRVHHPCAGGCGRQKPRGMRDEVRAEPRGCADDQRQMVLRRAGGDRDGRAGRQQSGGHPALADQSGQRHHRNHPRTAGICAVGQEWKPVYHSPVLAHYHRSGRVCHRPADRTAGGEHGGGSDTAPFENRPEDSSTQDELRPDTGTTPSEEADDSDWITAESDGGDTADDTASTELNPDADEGETPRRPIRSCRINTASTVNRRRIGIFSSSRPENDGGYPDMANKSWKISQSETKRIAFSYAV